MKRFALNAYNKLTRAGIKCYHPVNDRPSWANGHFDISAEEGDVRADYWLNPAMEEIQEILAPYGLFAEWVNPGVIAVHNA